MFVIPASLVIPAKAGNHPLGFYEKPQLARLGFVFGVGLRVRHSQTSMPAIHNTQVLTI
jgi:hypothetical protein